MTKEKKILTLEEKKKKEKYRNDWNAEHLDRVNLTMEKGKRAVIQAHAEYNGESANAFINRAINSLLDIESQMSVFDRLHKERNFFEWYNCKASVEEKALADYVMQYSEEFFSDFRFEPESVIREYMIAQSCDENSQTWYDDYIQPPYTFIRFFDQIVLEAVQYVVTPMEDNCEGMFNVQDLTITIPPRNLNEKSVILHESIHLHEAVIDQMPKFYHDILLLCLYNDLKEKIDDIDERIVDHTHIYWGDQITELGGNHDILFFLKSLDLDLKCGYNLGTVCGYGRDEYQE